MNTGDGIFGDKEVHKKFLNDPYFSASFLMTPREEWLCVDKEKSNLDGQIKKAKGKKISNLVVKEGNNVVGSINLLDLENKEWREINESREYNIPDSMSIFELVNRMAKDCKNFTREKSPLYFVYRSNDTRKEPVGLITFWDLNRAPVYILSYISLLYLEQTLLLKIRASHKKWSDHSEILKKIAPYDKKGYIKKFLAGPEYQYEILSKWGLNDLMCFYKNDPHVEKDSSSSLNDLVEQFSIDTDYRNRIAHTVKLLVNDNKKFRDDIILLRSLLASGKQAFINFSDPKVRHSKP